VLPDYSVGEFPIVALYPHREYVSAKVRSFVDFAAKHLAEDPASDAWRGEGMKKVEHFHHRIAGGTAR